MGRGKVELKRIENTTNRQATFSKRRNGLLKKAYELTILCDAEVALLVFSPSGKLYQFASQDCMDEIIAKYRDELGLPQSRNRYPNYGTIEYWKTEIKDLKRSIEALEAKNKHLAGEDLSTLGAKELRQLERQIQLGVERVRSMKRRICSEYITMIKRKCKALQEKNAHLQDKLSELQRSTDVSSGVLSKQLQ